MWKTTVKKDTDQENEGTVTAIWTDPTDSESTFIYEERLKRTAEGNARFVTGAKSALTAWQAKRSKLTQAESSLTSALNK